MGDYESSEEECGLQRGSKSQFILYKNRPEWQDVVPIAQDDGPNPVVCIHYSEKFSDVYGYARAILAMQEKSERALELTADALDLNPANYTIWQFRREILKELKSDLKAELKLSANMIHQHPKNYQVWYHRKAIVEMIGDPSNELQLTKMDLKYDNKNYHSWQHRQWVVQTYNLYEGELSFCDEMLIIDVRNNSAWNHRYFVVANTTGFTDSVISREVDYTINCIQQATHNESAWNYLHGVLKKSEGGIAGNARVEKFCEELMQSNDTSPHLFTFLLDAATIRHKTDPQSAKIHELCSLLANKVDPTRRRYWEFLSQQYQ